MTDPKWLIRKADIPESGICAVQAESETGGFSLILICKENVVHAFHNECPHAGRRLDWAPGKFLIERNLLICGAHGAMFQMDTGECVSGPCRGNSLCKVAVQEIDGEIFLP